MGSNFNLIMDATIPYPKCDDVDANKKVITPKTVITKIIEAEWDVPKFMEMISDIDDIL